MQKQQAVASRPSHQGLAEVALEHPSFFSSGKLLVVACLDFLLQSCPLEAGGFLQHSLSSFSLPSCFVGGVDEADSQGKRHLLTPLAVLLAPMPLSCAHREHMRAPTMG